MKSILKEKYSLFEDCFRRPAFRAMRINTLKADAALLKRYFSFIDEPVPFCKDSYYIPEDLGKPGSHPLHHAGAFYLQEPSASSVAEAAGIQKGDFVLDLCASPGGKATQAAAKLGGAGLLVANEFVQSRVYPLLSNIERMGIPNAVVTSARPDILCERFPEFFDKVIVDAPCSGEGMFRKEEAALANWSVENVKACAGRQKKILDCAAKAVKPGGRLVYSTCTYSPEENEQVVEHFLKNHKDFRLQKPQTDFGEDALPEFAKDTENITYARRIFNFNGGEGHFVAVMEKEGESRLSCLSFSSKKHRDYGVFAEFYKENFTGPVPENVVFDGNKVYIIPCEVDLDRLMIRNGIFAGTCRNGRFVPEHALYNTPFHSAASVMNLDVTDERVNKFLHGEEIPCKNEKGYTQVKICGIPVGFGKASGGMLKNHYPKGLRT